MAMIGSILLILGIVPWAGSVLSIIGVILLLMAIKGFSNNYQDPAMYSNALTGFIYYIIAAIAFAVSFGILAVGIVSIFLIGLGLLGFFAGLVVAFIFYIMAAKRLRMTLNTLAQKTGEHSFETAGTLLWWGAILTIIFIGGILIFIAWIFVAIGFFSMKTSGQQSYTYAPPPPPPPTEGTQAQRYCPNCGAPAQPNIAFCPNCGKQLPA
jgi:uncharacterized membrane protein